MQKQRHSLHFPEFDDRRYRSQNLIVVRQICQKNGRQGAKLMSCSERTEVSGYGYTAQGLMQLLSIIRQVATWRQHTFFPYIFSKCQVLLFVLFSATTVYIDIYVGEKKMMILIKSK